MVKFQKLSLLALLLLQLISSSFSWHSFGHLLVARLAKMHLERDETGKGKQVVKWANSLLRPFSAYCGEQNYPLVECATWADKIKSQGWSNMKTWHFSNEKVFAPGFDPSKISNYTNRVNVVWAIDDATRQIKSTKKDTRGNSSSALGKSLALRNLVHFVGDIHQPLHGVQRYSDKHDHGDAGGNAFKIQHYNNKYEDNLHFIWDHVFDQAQEINSPVSPSQYNYLSGFAEEIISTHQNDPQYLEELENHITAASWALEDKKLAEEFVYTGIVEGEALPEWYMAKGAKIVNLRLALAGKRLSLILLDIFENLQR